MRSSLGFVTALTSEARELTMSGRLATQFRRMHAQIDGPRVAFDMHVAVWRNNGAGECVIGAPTIEALKARWAQITGTPLDADRAQHVIVMRCEAPDALMDEAKAIVDRKEPPP